MNIENLCRRVIDFGFKLFEEGFAQHVKMHKIDNLSRTEKSLMWVRENDSSFDSSLIIGNRISDYLSILERQDYSYLMNDGGVIQIAFVYDGNYISQHRLLYYPCPFPIDPHETYQIGDGPSLPLIDFITEQILDDPDKDILLRSPIRFDYTPTMADDFHPASHLTINDPSCRIPVRSPLGFDTFVKFILENFYMEIWQNDKINQLLIPRQEKECLSAHDKQRAFLNWQYPA